MSKIKKPDYDGFRAEIATLYPAYIDRIAINQLATHDDARPVLRDIATQIDPDLVKKTPKANFLKVLDNMLLGASSLGNYVGTKFVNSTYHFFDKTDAEIIASIGTPAQDQRQCLFSYICIDERTMNPRRIFHSVSSTEISANRMKFNQAAMNPDAIKWFVFFHELGHATMALKAHGSDEPNYKIFNEALLKAPYKRQISESICDAFAASHVLRLYGDSALPMLRTWADMRLSRFPTRGHEYFTGPAISDIIRQYEQGSLQPLLDDPQKLFANALRTAQDSYLTEGQFKISLAILKAAKTGTDSFDLHSFKAKLIKKIFEVNFTAAGKDPETLTEQEKRLRAHYNEAAAVLKRDYRDSALGAFYGSIRRAIIGPLHAAGLAPHPGY